MKAEIVIAAKNLAGPAFKDLQKGIQASLKPLREMSKGLGALGRQSARLGQDFSKLARTTVATFAKVTASAGALGYGFKRVFVDVAAQAEETGRLLNNSLGREWGEAALKEVRAFSRATGRELGDVAQVYMNLQEAGLKPTERHLASIADLAAKKNKSMAEASADWAKALKGDAKALEDYQVKSLKNSKRFFVEYKDEAGKLVRLNAPLKDAEKMAELMERISQAKAGGADDERAQTFGGQIARLSAIWQEFRLQVMDNGPFAYLKEQLGELTAWVDSQDLGAVAKEWGGHITEALKAVREGLAAGMGKLKEWAPRALALGKSLGGLKTAAAALGVVIGGPLIKALGSFARSFALLGRTLFLTPVGILVGLGIALAAIAKEVGILDPLIEGLREGFKGFSEAITPSLTALMESLAESFGLASGNLKDIKGSMDPEYWKEMGVAIAELTTGALKGLIDTITMLHGKLRSVAGFAASVKTGMDVIALEQIDKTMKALDDHYQGLIKKQGQLTQKQTSAYMSAADALYKARDASEKSMFGGGSEVERLTAQINDNLAKEKEKTTSWEGAKKSPAPLGDDTGQKLGNTKKSQATLGSVPAPDTVQRNGGSGRQAGLEARLNGREVNLDPLQRKLENIDKGLAKQKEKPQPLEITLSLNGQVTGAEGSVTAKVKGAGISGEVRQSTGFQGATH